MTVYFSAIKATVLQQFTYIRDVLLSKLGLIMFIFIFYSLWKTTYNLGSNFEISGYSLSSMVWYISMTEAILMARTRVWVNISRDIKSGEIAYKLSKPYCYPVYIYFGSLGYSVVHFFINLIISSCLAVLLSGEFIVNTSNWLLFMGMSMMGISIDILIGIAIGLCAFFFEEVGPMYWVYDKLLFTIGGSFIPLEYFPLTLRRIAEALPLKTILYLPSKALVASNLQESLHGLFLQTKVFVCLIALIAIIWPICVRKVVINGG